MLATQKILFIGLWYHHYTQAIIDEVRQAGFDITYVDIQPRTFIFKVFKTLSAKHYQRYLDGHHRRAINQAAMQQYDQVVFLQTHQMSSDNLSLLRQTQMKAKFTLYNWDSISNHNYLSRVHFFDRVLTFDRDDARKHGFEYLPLFCVRAIQALRRGRSLPRSVYMVGNIVNINRYYAVKQFADHCKSNDIHFSTYLVVSPVVWLRMRSQGIDSKGLHFRSIPTDVFAKMTEDALAVFDFANHQQSGYTMRTIENLCAGKKIITNNRNVLADYFYSPDRILCFNEFDFSGVTDFLETPLVDCQRQFEEFHIQSFIQNLLGMQGTEHTG